MVVYRQRGKVTPAEAGATIAAAEQTILLAEELIGNSKASEVLLANVKEHLDAAKKAYNEGKYEKAYGLATSERAGPKCHTKLLALVLDLLSIQKRPEFQQAPSGSSRRPFQLLAAEPLSIHDTRNAFLSLSKPHHKALERTDFSAVGSLFTKLLNRDSMHSKFKFSSGLLRSLW